MHRPSRRSPPILAWLDPVRRGRRRRHRRSAGASHPFRHL